jgi:hypothetical protein
MDDPWPEAASPLNSVAFSVFIAGTGRFQIQQSVLLWNITSAVSQLSFLFFRPYFSASYSGWLVAGNMFDPPTFGLGGILRYRSLTGHI